MRTTPRDAFRTSTTAALVPDSHAVVVPYTGHPNTRRIVLARLDRYVEPSVEVEPIERPA